MGDHRRWNQKNKLSCMGADESELKFKRHFRQDYRIDRIYIRAGTRIRIRNQEKEKENSNYIDSPNPPKRVGDHRRSHED